MNPITVTVTGRLGDPPEPPRSRGRTACPSPATACRPPVVLTRGPRPGTPPQPGRHCGAAPWTLASPASPTASASPRTAAWSSAASALRAGSRSRSATTCATRPTSAPQPPSPITPLVSLPASIWAPWSPSATARPPGHPTGRRAAGRHTAGSVGAARRGAGAGRPLLVLRVPRAFLLPARRGAVRPGGASGVQYPRQLGPPDQLWRKLPHGRPGSGCR